jgi:hypothetical protein
MQFKLIAKTRAGTCILTDEGCLGQLTARDLRQGALDDLVAGQRVFQHDLGGNSDCIFLIVVDEPLPQARQRVSRTLNGQLELPSGRLVACGVEDLAKGPRAPEFATAIVEPATYLLEAYIIDPTGEPEKSDEASRIGCFATLPVVAAALYFLVFNTQWVGWALIACIVAFWVVRLLWYNLSGERQRKEASEADDPPDVVVRLVTAAQKMP